VTEAVALEMVIGDLGNQFWSQWLPAEVLTRAPPALPSRNTPTGFAFGPPWVLARRILTVSIERLHELLTPG
jgi:hypothetical protein